MSDNTKCGYIALLGQPNVGKSTLMNHILGQKISITSRKPQTTRTQVLGIKTTDNVQAIYVDTPGLHRQTKNSLNRYMNKAASGVINSVDVIVMMVSAEQWNDKDDWVLKKLETVEAPVVLVINKIDKLQRRDEVLPLIKQYSEKANFAEIIPISAKNPKDTAHFEKIVHQLLPEDARHYPDDQITDKSMQFMIAEIVREKIMRLTGDEIPYSVALEIEEYSVKGNIVHIGMLILVNRKNQKSIIIGKQGSRLKEIGCQARIDLEKMLDSKVFLRLWVKVKEGWTDNERALEQLGYGSSTR